MIFDVHCHLDHPDFEKDLDEVISRSKNHKVVSIISNGTNPASNRNVLAISDKYDIVHPALGIFPDEVSNLSEIEIEDELKFIKKHKDKIKALGEVGLDFSEDIPLKKQKNLFEQFISLSEKLKLPLIVHSRKAESEIIEVLTSSKVKKVILHHFSGNKKLIDKAYDNNFFFSIPTSIVKSQHFQFIVDKIPLSNLFTETDSPYLSPVKGERNEPFHVVETIKVIAKIKNLTIEEAEKILFMNYQKFFIKNYK